MSKKLISFLTIISAVGGLLTAFILYIPYDSSYRPWKNYISDLGGGPLGAMIAIGAMMVFVAVFITWLLILISKDIEKRGLQNVFLFFGIFAQMSLFFLGIFPLNLSWPRIYEIHRICGIIYFGFSAITYFFIAGFEFKTKKLSAILILLAGICAILFAVGFPLQEYGPLPRNAVTYIIQWTYFVLTLCWLILKLFPLKKK
jgi:hypothetical membrane protein